MKRLPAALAALIILTPAALAEIDYSIVPAPGNVLKRLKESKITIADAIDTAESEAGGRAHSARFDWSGGSAKYVVLVELAEGAKQVVVDAGTGAIVETTDIPALPGKPLPDGAAWQETPTGVQYVDLKKGEGTTPFNNESALQLNFTGYLVDGSKISDLDSAGFGKPIDVLPNRLFPGWTAGMLGMMPGSERKLIIPAEQAFGTRGQPPAVPPNATIILDVELLGWDVFSSMPENLPGEPVEGTPIKTDSGLMYYELVVGDGEQPTGPESHVEVHYTGWLNNGEKFDSSFDHPGGAPAHFQLGGVIGGWTEGVGGMKVGGKRKLIIPYTLGYQIGGNPRAGIPPKALLIFDVELLTVHGEEAH